MASEASVVWNKEGEERIPRQFGRLWLLRRLARGGMGEVYLASTSGIEGAERPCVVKIIRRDHAADKSFLARFFDEARVQAQLQHHGVAQVLEASTDADGEPYVVVEHVEGRSLGEVRARALHAGVTLEWAEVVAIGVSAAEALAHVHERNDAAGKPLGIVHRDLSPQNVMLGYGGDVKLIDFGTARAENRRCHTISGVVFAKPGYVAPEVAAGNSGDLRVDLYALGVILWELLAGRRFLQGDATEHLALVAKDERKLPPIAAQVGAPLKLDDVIAKLTAYQLDERYATARQVAADLVKLLATCAPLASGERSVRARAGQMMHRLYPSEPARSRAEFASLVKVARWAGNEESQSKPATPSEPAVKSPLPSPIPQPPPYRSPMQSITDGDPNVLPGTRYRMMGTIGKGAMGTVYEAQHVDLLRRVALKVLSQERAVTTDLAAFRHEAQAIANVKHPNLVMIHDFGEAADGRLYCAMELLEGQTLEQRLIQDTRLDWREAVKIGIFACHGLEAAHALGVIHCDLKPANLFVTKNATGEISLLGPNPGELKILDFGIAKTASEPINTGEPEREFTIAGTPEYMAPEQTRSHGVDARTDVYALGCVLYELCTGRRPFVATGAVALAEMKRHHTPEPMRVRSRSIAIPAALDRVVQKALAPNPDDRHASAEEFRRDLQRVLALPRKRRAAWKTVGYVSISGATLFAMTALGTFGAVPQLTHWKLPNWADHAVSRRVMVAAGTFGGRATKLVNHALDTVVSSAIPAVHRKLEGSARSAGYEVSKIGGIGAAISPPGPLTGREGELLPAGTPLSNQEAANVISLDNGPDDVFTKSFDPAPAPATATPPNPAPSAPPAVVANLAVNAANVALANIAPANIAPLGSSAQIAPAVASATALTVARSPAPVPTDVTTALAAGGAALKEGFSSQALLIHRDLADRHPRDAHVLKAWAETAAIARDWKEASDAAEKWSLADPTPEPRLFFARILALRGKPKAAQRMLEELLEAFPACDEARVLLAEHHGHEAPNKASTARVERAHAPTGAADEVPIPSP